MRTTKRINRTKNDERKAPLRKIIATDILPVGVGTIYEASVSILQEVYECGHVSLPKEDIYGRTNAVKRRCMDCLKNNPRHVDIEKYKED